MTEPHTVRDFDFKGLILDYGEVLCFRPTADQIQRMASVFGISSSKFMKLYDRNRREYDRGDLDAERYWFSFADEPGLRLRGDQIPSLRAWDVDMWSVIDPLMIDWLRAVHQSGVRTALLSNMPGDMIARIRSLPWINYLDCTVFSYEERLAKPEAKIYERCLEKLGTAPGQTLFVDDREVNVRTAQKLGIQAIQFESAPQFRAQIENLRSPLLRALSTAIPTGSPT